MTKEQLKKEIIKWHKGEQTEKDFKQLMNVLGEVFVENNLNHTMIDQAVSNARWEAIICNPNYTPKEI